MANRGRRNADESLLTALAFGATVENAARSAGVSTATVYRRLKDPAFHKRLDEIRVDMLNRVAAVMLAACMESVKTLVALQKDGIPPASRLGAARAIIELSIKVREVADLAGRVKTLEERLNK